MTVIRRLFANWIRPNRLHIHVMRTGRRQWPPPTRLVVSQKERLTRVASSVGRRVGIAAATSFFNSLRLSSQGGEVDHRAPNQRRRYFEYSFPCRDGSEDVVIFTQLDWSGVGVPVEDLQIPGTP